jgi:UDP-N-acetylglucosamine 2-epimerase (non-hydrolysing)
MRENTERPEVIQAGCGKLVGTNPQNILAATSELLRSSAVYQKMSQTQNPFGDGHAAERIVSLLY